MIEPQCSPLDRGAPPPTLERADRHFRARLLFNDWSDYTDYIIMQDYNIYIYSIVNNSSIIIMVY